MENLLLVITTVFDSGREMEETFSFDADVDCNRIKLTQSAVDFKGLGEDKINKYVVELKKVR